MSFLEDLFDGLINKAANQVNPGFAKFLQKADLQKRNAQFMRQALKQEAGLLGKRVTGVEAGNDVRMAFNSLTGRSTPEQEQQFLKKTPGAVGLDFLALLPALLARTPQAVSGFSQMLRRPLVTQELMQTGQSQFELQNVTRPGQGSFRFTRQTPPGELIQNRDLGRYARGFTRK